MFVDVTFQIPETPTLSLDKNVYDFQELAQKTEGGEDEEEEDEVEEVGEEQEYDEEEQEEVRNDFFSLTPASFLASINFSFSLYFSL